MGCLRSLLLMSVVLLAAEAIPWYKVEPASNVVSFQQAEDTDLNAKWEHFKQSHNKVYASKEEDYLRREIFTRNLQRIHEHNDAYEKGTKTYRMGINPFTDMDYDELSSMLNGYRPGNFSDEETTTYLPPSIPVTLPDSINWKEQGYVTPVKDQGQCGSCWAFSATGTLEGQHFRKTKKLVSLSEQNLLDCSTAFPNHGCSGGVPRLALKYVAKNKGIDTEESYPYEGKVSAPSCKFDTAYIGATCSGVYSVKKKETSLQEATALNGPISVAICVEDSFMRYENGVYNEPHCCTSLDHAVLVVGYGVDDTTGLKYWLVKNSWGTAWGDQGYIRMSRDANNQCGIANEAVFPKV